MTIFNHGREARGRFAELYGKSTYAQFKRYENLTYGFKKQYGHKQCYLISSSGRVEFCGNHTDHNGGTVIGCAVNLDIIGAFMPNGGNIVNIRSASHPPISFEVGSDNLHGGSSVAQKLINFLLVNGCKVGGFDLYTHSTVPGGAGVSSSAAFEMLVASVVNQLFNEGEIDTETLVKAGQYSEQAGLNKPCGLLDQGAVACGGMTLFDFKEGFKADGIYAQTDGFRLALINTGKSHASLSHLYAAIPDDMRDVSAYYGKQRLIDVDETSFRSELSIVCERVGADKTNRALHFFDENARVKQLAVALEHGNVCDIIRLVNESGDSSMKLLRNCSVDENDTAIPDAVNYARSLGNVGARVHGGGFAGTVLCVIPTENYKKVYKSLAERYGAANVLHMRIRSLGATVL